MCESVRIRLAVDARAHSQRLMVMAILWWPSVATALDRKQRNLSEKVSPGRAGNALLALQRFFAVSDVGRTVRSTDTGCCVPEVCCFAQSGSF